MRRLLTLVCLLFLAIPAGISISGCYRNPAGNFCNGLGFGLRDTDVFSIDLEPRTTGISLAYGQTQQIGQPTAQTCKGATASVSSYTYGTTNNKLVDISPTGNICAGTWNRNSAGGIPNFTICSFPNPLPTTGTSNLPYSSAYITAAGAGVTSNPVQVFVHAQVTSVSLVGPQQCLSQTAVAQLDAQACYSQTVQGTPTNVLLCAPASVTGAADPSLACQLPTGVALSAIPACTSSIGTMSYTVANTAIASINPETNQITAGLPGTTAISASIAGSGSSAGYFSTCPPASISVSLSGSTDTTVTQGVQQNLTTTVTDVNGHQITGLTLDYQSTNPLDITAGAAGAVTASFPGSASVYAICQPSTCNPSPINEVGVNGTGLSISSNPVDITTPGTASSFVWYAAPGQSQYMVQVELLSGTVGSTIRLPYVPNSMVMDQTGTNLYFGSARELMVFSTATNSLASQNSSVPGVVLSVSPNNSTVVINDQSRHLFYIYSPAGTGTVAETFGGMGNAAAWTPDSKTLYITDNANLNSPASSDGSQPAITGHSDTLYVYNVNTGWTTYPLPPSPLPVSVVPTSATQPNVTNLFPAQTPAVTVPGVGAYVRGLPTAAHTWCPSGIAGNYASMTFYPQGDSVNVQTDALSATPDGRHILSAAFVGGGITLSDIGITIPSVATNGITTPAACPVTTTGTGAAQVQTLDPLLITHTLNQTPIGSVQNPVNATSVNQIITSPAAVLQGTTASASSLSFITYSGTTPGATLPYYKQVAGASSTPGTVGYIPFAGSAASSITAPLVGAFSSDATLFFVSTAGDNMIHYIDTTKLQDTQQISPNLPACSSTTDSGCLLPANTPASSFVPATAIAVKPRSTT